MCRQGGCSEAGCVQAGGVQRGRHCAGRGGAAISKVGCMSCSQGGGRGVGVDVGVSVGHGGAGYYLLGGQDVYSKAACHGALMGGWGGRV